MSRHGKRAPGKTLLSVAIDGDLKYATFFPRTRTNHGVRFLLRSYPLPMP